MNNDLIKPEMSKKWVIILKGSIIGVAATAVAMLLFSAVMLIFELGRGFASPFATVSVALGSFLAALYAARKVGSRGYLTGLIVGLIAFAVVTLVSLIISGGGFTFNTLFHLIIILLSSMVGGILGINLHRSKKYI